jgi:hypothetical protein
VINSYLFHFSVLFVIVTTFPKICIWLITYVIARDFSPYVFHFHLIFAAGGL